MNLVIIDDDRLVCSALTTILEASGEVHVLAAGHDGAEGIALFRSYRPDILLMDIRMTGLTGLNAAEQILAEFPDARILFLTTFSDDEYFVKALCIGAKGYLLKADYDSILPALRAVSTGQSVFGNDIIAKLPALVNKKKSSFHGEHFDLTEKESTLISLVAEGLSNREISESMYLSEGTVRNYLSIILEKLQLRDRTQLAVFYYKNNNIS
jgi:DNA-binding NarL/FixJ family response regulator